MLKKNKEFYSKNETKRRENLKSKNKDKKAKEELGWEATKTLEDMCRDSWNYINS